MKTRLCWSAVLVLLVACAGVAGSDAPPEPVSPADNLPPHIKRLVHFGERADWSHDGQRLLFLSKTFGDAMELDLKSGEIRNLTAHYPHYGYTRALYLSNGDILLSGPIAYDLTKPDEARVQCYLFVLESGRNRPARPLNEKCSEGPAVSRKRLHIAWTHVARQFPDRLPAETSQIHEGDIVYEDGAPRLANQRLVLDSRNLPFKCTLETQNFRPPTEQELIFSAYGYQGTEVCGVNLNTGEIKNYSNAPESNEEAEGIYPSGDYTLVESNRHRPGSWRDNDIYRLALDGSSRMERLIYFADVPTYRSSNPVVSDDGRFIAFQLARSGDDAGVGHGIFVYDIEKAAGANTK